MRILKMNKALRIVFIEDDNLLAETLLAWAKDKGHEAWAVLNALDANKINADYYIFDMSAIGGTYTMHHCYSPLCTISEHHPGAAIVILTAWSKSVIQEIIDRVKEETEVIPIYIQTGKDCFDDLDKLII